MILSPTKHVRSARLLNDFKIHRKGNYLRSSNNCAFVKEESSISNKNKKSSLAHVVWLQRSEHRFLFFKGFGTEKFRSETMND